MYTPAVSLLLGSDVACNKVLNHKECVHALYKLHLHASSLLGGRDMEYSQGLSQD